MSIKNLNNEDYIQKIAFICIIFINIIILYNCSQKNDVQSKKFLVNLSSSKKDSISFEDQIKIDNTIGIVRFLFNNNDSVINLYDRNKEVWYSFTLNKYDTNKIVPFAINADYFLLIFRCIKKEELWYKVIVNERKMIVKYINAKDINFEFQNWEEHIKSVIISFDYKTNPLREYPENNSKVVKLDTNEFTIFTGDSIIGEWLRINDNENECIKGWIKWREKSKLLVELYYYL